jgi:hypothetical protein
MPQGKFDAFSVTLKNSSHDNCTWKLMLWSYKARVSDGMGMPLNIREQNYKN